MSKSIQVQDLPRVNEIAAVLARNGFGHMLSLIGLTSPLQPGSSEPTAPYARRARQALTDLGPTFVKLGQVLSVRPDILPEDVLTEFESLQDRVEPMPFSEVTAAVERELHRPLDDVFTEFDEEPLGSASIAQVHRAVLRESGQEVAVKLQRNGIERKIRSDLHILYSLAHVLEGNFTLPGLHTPTDIVREFDSAITMELDFLTELKSAQRFGENFRNVDSIMVPKVFPRWSTRRLMVMEMVHGKPLRQFLRDRPNEVEARRIAHLVMDATYRMVFDHGFFHGDPHPGNLIVDEQGRLAYLDFGVTGLLTGAMQDTIIHTFTSMVFRDPETLAMTIYRAGAAKGGRVDLRAFIEELERKMAEYYGASLDDLASPATFVEIVQMCTRFKLSLPPEFAVLARTITLVEGECRALLPGVDIVEEVKPYAQKLIRQRFSPDRVAQDMGRVILQAQGHLRDLPTQMNQVLMDLEGGNITIVTRDPDASALRTEIRSAVLRLSLAALAMTVSLGALLFLAAWSPEPFGIPVFGILGGMLIWVGVGFFGFLGIHVLFAQWLDLRQWRRRAMSVMKFFSWRR